MKYYLGVDPGWTNLAYAWLSEDGELNTGCIDPRSLDRGMLAPMVVSDSGDLNLFEDQLIGSVIERFVYYKGVHNPNSEQILMVTGQLQMWLAGEYGIVPTMFKAFDWKTRISKHIYKQGFRNPSDRLDKTFSLAAARFIFPDYDFKTDHEADAACMAYIARLLDR